MTQRLKIKPLFNQFAVKHQQWNYSACIYVAENNANISLS